MSYRFSSNPTLNRSTIEYSNISGAQYIPNSLVNKKVRPDNDSYEHTGQVDYTTPIKKNQTISAGAKLISRTNETDTKQWDASSTTPDVWTLNETKSRQYRNTNSIYATYLEYGLNVGKWNTAVGLRHEYNALRVKYLDGKEQNFNKHFSDFLPSFRSSYKLSEAEMFKLGFNSRISRPDIEMLSPYVNNDDGINLKYGNPQLDTERGYNATLGYSKFGQKFSINTELSGMINNNGLTSYSFLDGNHLINETYDNFMHHRNARLSVFINWACTKTTSVTFSTEGGYQYYAVKQINARNDGWDGNVMLNIKQSLPWKMKASCYCWIQSRQAGLQGTNKGYNYHSISISRSFLDEDRLNVTLSAQNMITPTFKWRETKETDQYKSYTEMRNNRFYFRVNVSWRLGKLNTFVKKTKRTIDNDDKATVKDKNNTIGNFKM